MILDFWFVVVQCHEFCRKQVGHYHDKNRFYYNGPFSQSRSLSNLLSMNVAVNKATCIGVTVAIDMNTRWITSTVYNYYSIHTTRYII